MLKDIITANTLFIETSPLIQKIGLDLVDITESEQHNSVQVRVVVKALNRITTIGDCTRVHKLLEPRLELLVNNKDLNIEVSTPGLQRNFKDVYEFKLFKGENVKVFDDRISEWVTGRISDIQTEDDVLSLDIFVKKENNTIKIPYKYIKKAKLEVVWGDKK
ncbi:MAG: ribosome assembly cofactor RimP [Spirochaetales bacterium]|nr:ribosome assembly cofactor RimP [Spirochaetales bacterium]